MKSGSRNSAPYTSFTLPEATYARNPHLPSSQNSAAPNAPISAARIRTRVFGTVT